MRKIFAKLLKRKATAFGLWVLFLFIFLSIFSEFFSPYAYNEDHRSEPYHPPVSIHFFDTSGKFHLRPFIYDYEVSVGPDHEILYEANQTTLYPIQILPKVEPYQMWGVWELDRKFVGVKAPARLYLLGSDERGRDLLSRILEGGRISLSIGVIGVLISLFFGCLVGGLSGYFSGKTDVFLMRFTEVFMLVPGFYLLLAIRSSLPADVSSLQVYLMVTVVLGAIGWAPIARVVRGMVLKLSNQEYVKAAKLLGTADMMILFKHILPQILSYLVIVITMAFPGYLVAESALSILGLGIQEPFVSWGMLLADATSFVQIRYHSWILFPVGVIVLTILSFNIVGDHLQEILNPKEMT